MANSATVLITFPDGQQRRVSLGSGGLRIGRALDNDLVVPDASIALYHAVIRPSAGGASRLGELARQSGGPILIEVPADDDAGAAVRIGGFTIRLSAPQGLAAA
jgi:hypothetical protein